MITVVGSLIWDTIYAIDTLPRPGELKEARIIHQGPGGSASNTAAWLASSRNSVRLVSRLGSCTDSAQIRQALEELNLFGPSIVMSEGKVASCVIMKTQDGERTMLYAKGTLAAADDELKSHLARTSLLWVHDRRAERRQTVYGLAPPKSVKGLPLVHLSSEIAYQRENGKKTWDLVVGSIDEAPIPTEKELAAVGCRFCVVTLGKQGGQYWSPGSEWRGYLATPVDAKDTTGAGDAFLAGVLQGLHKKEWGGKVFEEAIALGASLGARAVEQYGAWPQ